MAVIRRLEERDREEPSSDLETQANGALPKAALIASFGLSFVGWLTALLGLFFMFSVFFFVASGTLAYPIVREHPAAQVRKLARVALGVALAGCFSHLLWAAVAVASAPSVGRRALELAATSLLIPVVFNVLRKR